VAFFGFPYRGVQIVWAFRALMDEKTCDDCGRLDNTEYVVELEGVDEKTPANKVEEREAETTQEVIGWVFKDAERQDEDFIRPNVHENCRCILEKVPNE
jgi:hypothetical protein